MPTPGFAQEVAIVSDQPKNKGIPAILRHLMMLSLVAGTSALGASVAIYLQSEKTPADEEKHSNAGAGSHDESKNSHAKNGDESHSELDTHEPTSDGHDEQSLTSHDHSDDSSAAKASDPETPALRTRSRKTSSVPDADQHESEANVDSPFDEFVSTKTNRDPHHAPNNDAEIAAHADPTNGHSEDDPFSVENLGFGPVEDSFHDESSGEKLHPANDRLSPSNHGEEHHVAGGAETLSSPASSEHGRNFKPARNTRPRDDIAGDSLHGAASQHGPEETVAQR